MGMDAEEGADQVEAVRRPMAGPEMSLGQEDGPGNGAIARAPAARWSVPAARVVEPAGAIDMRQPG